MYWAGSLTLTPSLLTSLESRLALFSVSAFQSWHYRQAGRSLSFHVVAEAPNVGPHACLERALPVVQYPRLSTLFWGGSSHWDWGFWNAPGCSSLFLFRAGLRDVFNYAQFWLGFLGFEPKSSWLCDKRFIHRTVSPALAWCFPLEWK